MSSAQPDCKAIPTTLTPRPAYFSRSLLKVGISARQGSHQVAQKPSTTTTPFKSAELICRPSMSSSLNSAASWSDSCLLLDGVAAEPATDGLNPASALKA